MNYKDTNSDMLQHGWTLKTVALPILTHGASLVAQLVKNTPAMQETYVQSLGWEDPLEKGTATHSSIRTWRIPLQRSLAGYKSMGSQRVRHD